jgi:hypothetical protein
MDYEVWLKQANESVQALPSARIFVLKDLFQGVIWSELERGQKLSLGRQFKNKVLDGTIPNVEYIGKADNNSAKYKRL